MYLRAQPWQDNPSVVFPTQQANAPEDKHTSTKENELCQQCFITHNSQCSNETDADQ